MAQGYRMRRRQEQTGNAQESLRFSSFEKDNFLYLKKEGRELDRSY
jgi:hypothetical protein